MSEFFHEITKLKRESLSTKNVVPTCLIDDIPLPKNAKKWSCDQVISDNIIPKNTKCRLLCQDGYEVTNCTYFLYHIFATINVNIEILVAKRDYHRCTKSGEWHLPMKIDLKCNRDRKLLSTTRRNYSTEINNFFVRPK